MPTEIRIGTSGYHFKDWVGTVYPKGLQPKNFLPYYAQMFDCVEVNASFYQVPTAALFEGMLAKVPHGFQFAVKTPKEMTHDRHAFSAVEKPFLASLEPLRDNDRLGTVLAQFPYSYRPTDPSYHHLETLSRALVGRGVPTSVEFRHRDWYREETFRRLRELGLGFVNVDLPRLAQLPEPSNRVTSNIAYYRLHGRNAEMWWKHPTPSHRYDYSYSPGELSTWTSRIEEVRPQVEVVFAFTNNCRMGASIVDALRMKQLLSLDALLPEQAAATGLFEDAPADPLDARQRRVEEARALDAPAVEQWRSQMRDSSQEVP